MDEPGAGPRRLGLELRFEPEPIRGRLYDHDADGLDRAFTGWLGLMSAIEAVRIGDAGAQKEEREQ